MRQHGLWANVRWHFAVGIHMNLAETITSFTKRVEYLLELVEVRQWNI